MVPVPQTSPQTPPVLRRTPVQQRSAERLARILDACAALLDETGYEQLSTRAVAARAGVPIGSVYRFFGNKRAMVAALAHRNLDEYAERISTRFAATSLLDAHGAIDGVLDEFIAMKRTVPGFALVDFGVPAAAPGETSAEGPVGSGESAGEAAGGAEEAGAGGSGEDGIEGLAEDPNRLVVDRICALLATHLGRTVDDDLRRKVLVGVETADALVRLAFRADPAGDPALVDETRHLLHAYLAPSLSS
ncbi:MULTISPECIES: TetR family transcriptional regulator [Streptomyces]|uniref:TetR family transcriptional regulator n=1 Tax=Streptomyces viridochromogenes TaxID=1938 RepID=A0A0L8KNC8_STRVR|nr:MULTISPECIES: TetR family transcriptional regulator [Streptomyces]KOG27427.1 TetR family transcriptional regulator [Streptomyces viridochromogenes]